MLKLFLVSKMKRRWKRIITNYTDHFCLLCEGRLKRKNEEAVGPKTSRPDSTAVRNLWCIRYTWSTWHEVFTWERCNRWSLHLQNGGRLSPLGNPQVSENCQTRDSGHEILEKTQRKRNIYFLCSGVKYKTFCFLFLLVSNCCQRIWRSYPRGFLSNEASWFYCY